jgi:hypothetical protein
MHQEPEVWKRRKHWRLWLKCWYQAWLETSTAAIAPTGSGRGNQRKSSGLVRIGLRLLISLFVKAPARRLLGDPKDERLRRYQLGKNLAMTARLVVAAKTVGFRIFCGTPSSLLLSRCNLSASPTSKIPSVRPCDCPSCRNTRTSPKRSQGCLETGPSRPTFRRRRRGSSHRPQVWSKAL